MAIVRIPGTTRRPPAESTTDTGEPVVGSGWYRVGDVGLHLAGLRVLNHWPTTVNYPHLARMLEEDPRQQAQTIECEVFTGERSRYLHVGIRYQHDRYTPPSSPKEFPSVAVKLQRVSDGLEIDSGFTMNAADLDAGAEEEDLDVRLIAAVGEVPFWPIRFTHSGAALATGSRPRLLAVDAHQRTELKVVLTTSHARIHHVDVWEWGGGLADDQVFTP